MKSLQLRFYQDEDWRDLNIGPFLFTADNVIEVGIAFLRWSLWIRYIR